MTEIIPDLLNYFREKNINATDEQLSRIAARVSEMASYQAKVAIFGKTGSGKSSLCNAVFGEDVAPVSDIEACTRSPQEYLLQLAPDKSIILVDVPGVGESVERDQEYIPLYESLLPQVDLLLWVVRCDDRAMTIDLHVWSELVRKRLGQSSPACIVLNQVDRVNPVRGWNVKKNEPGTNQREIIEGRIQIIARDFALPASDVIAVSSVEGFGITALVEHIVHALPNDKKLPFLNAVREERRSESAKTEAKKGFFEAVGQWIKNTFTAIEPYIPTIIDVIRILFKK